MLVANDEALVTICGNHSFARHQVPNSNPNDANPPSFTFTFPKYERKSLLESLSILVDTCRELQHWRNNHSADVV